MKKLIALCCAALVATSAAFADVLPTFSATLTVGKQTRFVLTDATGKSSPWLTIGESFNGYSLKSYNAKNNELTVELNGKQSVLPLADSTIANGPAGVGGATPATIADATAVLDQMQFEKMMDRTISALRKSQADQMKAMLPANMSAEDREAAEAFRQKVIDGTKSFITGVPLWGTLIALLHQGQPILGCIHQPVLGQLVMGDGTATTLNGRPTRVRPCPRLADATLLTSDPVNPGKYQNGASWAGLERKVRLTRTWGDCYGYLLVATGLADVMVDPIMNPWDIAALIPVIRGAGGVITDWQGGAPYPAESTVAAGPELHAEVIALLNG